VAVSGALLLLPACARTLTHERYVTLRRYRYGDSRDDRRHPVALLWKSEDAYKACMPLLTANVLEAERLVEDAVEITDSRRCKPGIFAALSANTEVELMPPSEQCGPALVRVRLARASDPTGAEGDVFGCLRPKEVTSTAPTIMADGSWLFVVPAERTDERVSRWKQIGDAHSTAHACEDRRAATLSVLHQQRAGSEALQTAIEGRCVPDDTTLDEEDSQEVSSTREFLDYRRRVIASIESYWMDTRPNPKTNLVVKVRFAIGEDGAIDDIRIEHASGEKAFDHAAVEAVEHANPLPPPPSRYRTLFQQFAMEFHSGEAK
jgi:TonB family protein